MSYSQIVLSENPYGYWEFSDTPVQYDYFTFDNLTYQDLYYDMYDEGVFTGLSFDNTVYIEKYFKIYGENIIEYQNNLVYTDTYGSIYDRWAFEIKDFSIRSNNGIIIGQPSLDYKPIVPGCQRSVKFNNTDIMFIPNIYGMFFKGTENKNFSIEFFFSTDSSSIEDEHTLLNIGNLLRCYVKSDKIYLESNSTQVFVPVATWDASNYVCITYENRVLSLIVNNNTIERILLGAEYYFPDTTPQDIVVGPSANSSISFFMNALALYSYILTNDQINRRLAWNNYLPSIRDISAEDEGDYFNLSYSSVLTQQKILLTSPETLSDSLSNNVQVVGDTIQLREYANPEIIGNRYLLNSDGFRSGPDTYINLIELSDAINNSNCTIRMQAKVFGTLSNITYQEIYNGSYDEFDIEETLAEFGPLDNYQSCRLYKSLDKKITLSLTYLDGTEEIILQSSALTNFDIYQNIAINFDNQLVSLKVNSQELTATSPFPSVSSNPFFRIGNSSYGDSPTLGKIKNFTIDQLVDFAEIDFTDVGKYTLKLAGDLKISQSGQWYYSFTPTEPIVSSYVTYNTASKNSSVYINDIQVSSNTIIPDLDYANNNPINILIEFYTDDSENDLSVFNNLYLVLYEDVEIASENAIYTISPIATSDTSPEVNIEPYILSTENVPLLSKPNNIGIKFINGETSGGVVYPYDDSGSYITRFVDFVMKLDSIPTTETFTIFDTSSTINKKLTYTSSGLQKIGSFTLYVDGEIADSGKELNDKDFYHIAIDFGAEEPDLFFIGSDRSGSNGMSGSIGELTVNENLPTSVSSYLYLKNQALIGRISISYDELDEISFLDNESPTQSTFISGGKYFEMTTLPKVKAIENRWESLSIPE